MKIVFIVSAFPSLSETFILNQITGIIDLGHEVEIFSKSNPKEEKVHPDFDKYVLRNRLHYYGIVPSNKMICRLKALAKIGFGFITRPVKTSKILKGLFGHPEGFSYKLLFLAIALLRNEPDIIHCHFGPCGNIGLFLKGVGIEGKLVTSFHGYDVNSYPRIAGEKVYEELFEHGDIFTANTNFTKGQMESLGCDGQKVRIIPESLKCGNFAFKARTLSSGEKINILTVGRLVEKKGYEYSLRAIAKVIDDHKNIIYRIVGGGPLQEKLMSLVSELGIEDYVEFMGPLDESRVLELYNLTHIFILPSVTAADGDREGQALVLQEAQVCGIPVISTIHNGIPDGVIDGESGFLVPERDVDALAERIEYLILNSDKWSIMGKSGHEFVVSKYDTAIVNETLVRIYDELTGK